MAMVNEVGYITVNYDWATMVFTGTIVADNGESIDAEGQMLLKERYPRLYKTIKDAWPNLVETETEFQCIDLRGKAVDHESGNQPLSGD